MPEVAGVFIMAVLTAPSACWSTQIYLLSTEQEQSPQLENDEGL